MDLLSDTKAREIILTKEYLKQIHLSPEKLKSKIQFQHFDFHGFCSGDKYHQLKILIGRLNQGFTDFSYFIEDCEAKKVMKL